MKAPWEEVARSEAENKFVAEISGHEDSVQPVTHVCDGLTACFRAVAPRGVYVVGKGSWNQGVTLGGM